MEKEARIEFEALNKVLSKEQRVAWGKLMKSANEKRATDVKAMDVYNVIHEDGTPQQLGWTHRLLTFSPQNAHIPLDDSAGTDWPPNMTTDITSLRRNGFNSGWHPDISVRRMRLGPDGALRTPQSGDWTHR